MKPLERLFVLEIEFQRRSRESTTKGVDRLFWELHSDYPALTAEVGEVTVQEVDRFSEHMLMLGNERDVLEARDAIVGTLGLRKR